MLGEPLSSPLVLRDPARGPQLAETHASDASDDGFGEGPRFVLAAVAIEGATVYRPEELRPLYQGLLGREIALDAVFALAEAVSRRATATTATPCHRPSYRRRRSAPAGSA